jgi:hypothetical protein
MRSRGNKKTCKPPILYDLRSTIYAGHKTMQVTAAIEAGTASRVWSIIDLLIS